MSKGNSSYFTGTSGEGRSLIAEVKAHPYKINEDEVIGIAKGNDGKIVWLEKGHLGKNPSGLAHIVDAHETHFNNNGISSDDIADFVLTAVTKGKIVGYQGKGTGRPIFEVTYKGNVKKVAVTIGDNGYIVGANPKSD